MRRSIHHEWLAADGKVADPHESMTLSASSTCKQKPFRMAGHRASLRPQRTSRLDAPSDQYPSWPRCQRSRTEELRRHGRFICSDRANAIVPLRRRRRERGQVRSSLALPQCVGAGTSTSVTVMVDLAAPTVTIESPSSGGSTALASATVTAHVSDALSGVVSAKATRAWPRLRPAQELRRHFGRGET